MKVDIFFLILNLSAIVSCKSSPISETQRQTQDKNELSILSDTSFSNGIYLVGTNSANPVYEDTLYPFGKTNISPSWKIVQWASKFNIKDAKPEYRNDTVIYQNTGKRLSFFKMNKTTLVGLEVVGSKEYTEPRKANESWPHLLLEQSFLNRIGIAKIQKLNYTIDARLMYDENKMGTQFNSDLHSAQISLYFSIANVNSQSSGYEDFFWFGLPLYDYRYKDISEYAAQDLGKDDATKKFILNVASKELFNGSLQDKQWISINKDIYPLLISAFYKAKGSGFLVGSKMDDLSITSINIGWEVPGTFDYGIQLKNFTLKALLK